MKNPQERKRMMNKVTVIGGGFAGVEAAWQLANRGISVDLYEMKLGSTVAEGVDTSVITAFTILIVETNSGSTAAKNPTTITYYGLEFVYEPIVDNGATEDNTGDNAGPSDNA